MYDDCFAKMEIKKCGVLKKMLCQNGKCTFFAYRQEGRTTAGRRLRSKRTESTKKQYKVEQEKYPHRDKIAGGGDKNGIQ